MSKKLIIAKSKKNALSEPNLLNLQFTSDLLTLKTAGKGTIIKDVSAGTIVQETVEHPLLYPPIVNGFFRDASTNKWFMMIAQPAASQEGRPLTKLNVGVSVIANKIIFYLANGDTVTHTIELRYEYFYEGSKQ